MLGCLLRWLMLGNKGERPVIRDFRLCVSLVSLALSEAVDVELGLKGIHAKSGNSLSGRRLVG